MITDYILLLVIITYMKLHRKYYVLYFCLIISPVKNTDIDLLAFESLVRFYKRRMNIFKININIYIL